MAGTRRAVVGSDTTHETASAVVAHLRGRGWEVVCAGAVAAGPTPWPEVAEQVARLAAAGAVELAVVCCWTGTGVSIAANKVPGARAALCADAETAAGARRWNDANVLALALASTSPRDAVAILDAWLGAGGVEAGERANVARVTAMERRYTRPPGAGSDSAASS